MDSPRSSSLSAGFTDDDPANFVVAAKDGNFEAVRMGIEEGSVEVDCVDADGTSALAAACCDPAAAPVVEYLLHCGANPNLANDTHGWTPLITAAYFGNLPACELLLLLAGDRLDTGAVDVYGRTATSYLSNKDAKPYTLPDFVAMREQGFAFLSQVSRIEDEGEERDLSAADIEELMRAHAGGEPGEVPLGDLIARWEAVARRIASTPGQAGAKLVSRGPPAGGASLPSAAVTPASLPSAAVTPASPFQAASGLAAAYSAPMGSAIRSPRRARPVIQRLGEGGAAAAAPQRAELKVPPPPPPTLAADSDRQRAVSASSGVVSGGDASAPPSAAHSPAAAVGSTAGALPDGSSSGAPSPVLPSPPPLLPSPAAPVRSRRCRSASRFCAVALLVLLTAAYILVAQPQSAAAHMLVATGRAALPLAQAAWLAARGRLDAPAAAPPTASSLHRDVGVCADEVPCSIGAELAWEAAVPPSVAPTAADAPAQALQLAPASVSVAADGGTSERAPSDPGVRTAGGETSDSADAATGRAAEVEGAAPGELRDSDSEASSKAAVKQLFLQQLRQAAEAAQAARAAAEEAEEARRVAAAAARAAAGNAQAAEHVLQALAATHGKEGAEALAELQAQ